MVTEDFMTLKEAAAIAGASVDTLRLYIKRGELHAVMPFGNRYGYRVSLTDLQAFIALHWGREAPSLPPLERKENA